MHQYLQHWATWCKLNMHASRNQGYQCERQYALRRQPWQTPHYKELWEPTVLFFFYKKAKKITRLAPRTTVASKHSFDDKNLPRTSSHKRRKTARKTNGKHARCTLNGQHAAKVWHSPLCCAGGHHHFGTSRCLWMLFVTIGFQRLYKHRQ